MSIAFLVTAPPSSMTGTDAVLQEAELLRSRFGGEIVYLLPSSKPQTRIPRPFYGLHRLRAIRCLEEAVDVHHVFNPDLFLFPALRFLRKPVVYSVVSGLGARRRLPGRRALARLGRIVVPTSDDLRLLKERGLRNGRLIRPGIDLTRFPPTPPPTLDGDFVLVAGSAPWTEEQFRTKGFEALFEAAQQLPWLRLILLWRGFLTESLRARLRAYRLEDRVEVIEHRVDVSDVIARAHAAIVLAKRPELIKAYPHSLLEALAVGRPVIVNERVPISTYLTETDCGIVSSGIEVESLTQAIGQLRVGYGGYQSNAAKVGRRDFSQEAVVEAYGQLYDDIARAPAAP